MFKINYWFLTSLILTTIIVLPILTVFVSFFGTTSGYYELLTNTFLFSYISQSLVILLGVLILTFSFGVLTLAWENHPVSAVSDSLSKSKDILP